VEITFSRLTEMIPEPEIELFRLTKTPTKSQNGLSKSTEMDPEPISQNSILELYKTFFKYSRIQGLLPYEFDSTAMELTPITSGFFYYYFKFNTLYIILDVSKSALLFTSNWATNFQDEEIKGGYLLQLLWVIGPGSVLTMIYSFSHTRKEFAKTVTDCIRLESRIVAGNEDSILLGLMFHIAYFTSLSMHLFSYYNLIRFF
jgi:hypothetical protein